MIGTCKVITNTITQHQIATEEHLVSELCLPS